MKGTAEAVVFGNEDLRRTIFSYLRSIPKHECNACGAVCVWDVRLLKQYVSDGFETHCAECYWHRNVGPRCVVS